MSIKKWAYASAFCKNLWQCLVFVWSFIGTSKAQITILLAIFAGAWALHQYNIQVQKTLVERTLAYVERSQEGEVRDSLQVLSNLWIQDQVLDELDRTKDCKKREWPELAKTLIESTRGIVPVFDLDQVDRDTLIGTSLKEDVLTARNFYTDVSICALKGVCQKTATCDFFGLEIFNFKFLYGNLLKNWGDRWGYSLAREMKIFSEQMCGVTEVPNLKNCELPSTVNKE